MSIIGGGGSNYFARINQDLAAHGPDAAATESARAASGGKADQAKHAKADEPHTKHVGRDHVQLSKPMAPVMDDKDAAELADLLGLGQELRTDEDGQVEARSEYNRERNLKMDEGDASTKRVVGANGKEQFMDDDHHERLQVVDDEQHPYHLNRDVPQAALEAAGRIVHTQTQKSIKKVAELKHVPEAEEAGGIETALAGMETEPMDIMDPSSDTRFQPMSMELPDSTHEMAAEIAAQQLANGELGEEIILNP